MDIRETFDVEESLDTIVKMIKSKVLEQTMLELHQEKQIKDVEEILKKHKLKKRQSFVRR